MRTIIYFCLVALVFVSCKKDDNAIVGEWEVWQLRASDEADWEDAPESYVMTFSEDNSVSLSLDVNTCGSTYSRCTCGSLSIDQLGCTEACCDSDFAAGIVQLLPHIERHDIQGDVLQMNGSGSIKLKRL